MGAIGMEGTLSARPEGVFVSAGRQDQSTVAVYTQCQYTSWQLKNAAIPTSAAMLASLAVAAHFIDPLPVTLAPVCAALSALIVGLMWRTRSAATDSEPQADVALADEACAKSKSDAPAIGWSSGPRSRPNPRLAAELAQAAALAQLTARISHELRTPLNAVIGFSELMSRETFGPLGSQRYQNYAEHILTCGQTLLKSAEDTLAITSALAEPVRDLPSAAQPVALRGLLVEAWQSLALQTTQKGLLLDCDIPDDLELSGDQRTLRQVFINLMRETIDRSSQSSPILVEGTLEGQNIKLTFACYGGQETDADDSLAICVARALLEVHGLHLDTERFETGSWRSTVVLERSLQQDFFALEPGAECIPDARLTA